MEGMFHITQSFILDNDIFQFLYKVSQNSQTVPEILCIHSTVQQMKPKVLHPG